MTQGILIFAYNNGTFDYVKQALWAADRAAKFLNKPVTIITNEESLANRTTLHNIIFADADASSKRNFKQQEKSNVSLWFNGNRYQAYELSPYDETIIIDSDYVVCSEQLNLLYVQKQDFLTHRSVVDLGFKKSYESFDTFGQLKMPHYWATILFFRKTQIAKDIFDLITMIRNNYRYYSQLYKFVSAPYRNDHAVSIAQIIAYGHRADAVPSIKWNLPTLPYEATLKKINDDTFDAYYEKWNRNKVITMRNRLSGIDFHCMNKFTLEDVIDADM